MLVNGQNFLILGASKSGVAVGEYLLTHGANCYVFDEVNSEKVKENIEKIISLGGEKLDREKALSFLPNIDVVIISPGVPINHELAVFAKKLGKRIIGELEFGFLQFTPLTVAVTGTNGKTTTVSMIESILNIAEVKNKSVGNIGYPITAEVETTDKNQVLVTEVSSFQLESIYAFCPHIACVLNISPDHLERHYNMENYIFLKHRLLKNQTQSEFAVLNYDDETVKSFSEGLKSKIIWISCEGEVDGAYSVDGALKYKGEFIVNENDIPLGLHNKYNALFAIAVCKLLGVKNEDIKKGLNQFHGVKHRLELVKENGGVKYYNDSKSTNTSSTISALNAVKAPIVLILGGSEKGETYDKLFEEIKKLGVKHTVITGASKKNMLLSAMNANCQNVSVTSDFNTAVKIANAFADNGDVVLFSPACASFDNFTSYEERGDAFVKAVGELN